MWEIRDKVDNAAMSYVMEYERNKDRKPEDVSQLNLGWDITSRNPTDGSELYIEVKGHKGKTESLMSKHEWGAAKEHAGNYYLYVVFYALNKGKRTVVIKRDPANKANATRRVSYVIKARDVEGV